MDKQELIEKYKNILDKSSVFAVVSIYGVLDDLEKLDEPEKVTIPKFVADYIEFKKTYDFHVYGAMREIEDHYDKRVPEWFYENNIETFARAWLDGYELEEEKRYVVKIPVVNQYLVRVKDENFLGFLTSKLRTYFTRKELEDAGFGWVFDCPGVQIEEVK